MNQLVFIGIGVSIFLASLLISKKNKKSFDTILAIWLTISCIQLSFFYWSTEFDLENIPQAILFPMALIPYLSAPILFFYVSALTSKRPFHFKYYWFHLLPYFVMLISFYYVYYFETKTLVYVQNAVIFVEGKLPLHMRHHGWSMAFIYVAYPIWSILLLVRHRKKVDFEFSFHEKVSMNWLRNLIIFEMIFFLIAFCVIWIIQSDYLQLRSGFRIISVTQACYIFLMGYYGVKQEGIFMNYTETNQSKIKYAKSSLNVDKMKSIANTLNEHMLMNKPYLEPRITINQLADQISIKKHILSQVLNDHLDISFYDYINYHRVQEFKKRLNSGKALHLSLLGVALECGFNSKSSFNQVFKKHEDQTPSEYYKKLSE